MEQIVEQISIFDIEDKKITDIEIRQALSRGSGFNNGKSRINDYCKNENSLNKIAEFLKNEYGTGGWTDAISGNFYSDLDHNPKGITISTKNDKAKLSWLEVAKIIKELVNSNLYMEGDTN